MKRMTIAQMSRSIISKSVGSEEMKKRRREYEEQRDAYLNSNEGKFDQEVRKAAQTATEAEEEAYAMFFKAAANLREETLELIKRSLDTVADGEEVKNLNAKQVKFALDKCGFALIKLKSMSENAVYKEHKNLGVYNEYEKLFNTLIDKVNIRFALFAPALSVSRKAIKFQKMNKKERALMLTRLEKFGLTENEEYMEAHMETFEEIIKNKGIEV